ncbi:MAG: LemA family protein [Bdellovibrionales bacterium]
MARNPLISFWIAMFLVVTLTGCGIQSIPQAENQVDAASAEVVNQYKRRADLVPNLVNVVKGYAKHEQETLEGVVEARSKATQMTIDPTKASPEQIAKFQQAQGQLSQALGRLLMLQEQYPNLKADAQFRDLQAQLEGTENRITVARNRLIESIRDFNNLVTVPPTSWTNAILYHKDKKAQWDVSPGEREKIETAPTVNF